jgi:hypothetical protein
MNSELAREIMLDFAERTGLADRRHGAVRYLWTDAFAVCNYLGLYLELGDETLLDLALRLVDQTHHVLGRHRPDDARSGWISGLSDEEGEAHPTRGGLRIGKPLPERGPDEGADPSLEWERDGQYFHYLTRWMHALERVARVTGERRYHRFACELAEAACAGFIRSFGGGPRRLFWKMSTDLSRPQVAATGQHDPLDGLITCLELQASDAGDPKLDLGHEIRELAALCTGRSFDTDDPLGIGGLLCDAWRLVQLAQEGVVGEPQLVESLLASSLHGLDVVVARGDLQGPAEARLAFRELGLSIGIHALERIEAAADDRGTEGADLAKGLDERARALLGELSRHASLADRIERFWVGEGRRDGRLWLEHRDINEVMLATSLAPRGYLAIGRA